MKRARKSAVRSYRFSKNTQVLLAKLQKRTKKTQDIVVQESLTVYENYLEKEDKMKAELMKSYETAKVRDDGKVIFAGKQKNYLNPFD
jgi:hypothetical protein